VKLSEKINRLMFDYDDLSDIQIDELTCKLPNKMLRWLGAHHPDNKTRKLFFSKTNILIGQDTVINQNFVVSDNYEALLEIGNRVAISPNVIVICASAPNNSYIQHIDYVKNNLIVDKAVVIEDDVWIGANSVILPGVIIRRGSVIGAGSVVTKSTLINSTYAGIPAKQINSF
jgi:acetyltransferase-like isoleucine patch superfamily enzyme